MQIKYEQILKANGIPIEWSGGEMAIFCPFCEKTYQGQPAATLNIEPYYGRGSCSACHGNFEWEEITEKLELKISTYEKKTSEKDFSKINTKRVHTKGKAISRRFDEIKSVHINWLWKGRIALGKLTMIVGDPGLGKSLVTATLAAHVSKGYPWPTDESTPEIGDVIFLSAEDDPADTIKPRLEAMDADSSRIHILEAIQETDGEGESKKRMFSFKQDVVALENLLSSLSDCRLIIIDPVSAYLEGSDSNKNSDIRSLLAPLAEMAARHKTAIVLVSHLNKRSGDNALYRTTGSLAFIAAVRSAYIVTKDKNNPERRLMIPLKNNIAKDTTGLAYSIMEGENKAPMVVWETEVVEITADEALAPLEKKDDPTLTDEAVEFLKEALADGSVRTDIIQKEAKQFGITKKALVLARERLNVKAKKIGFSPGYWELSLPAEDSLNSEDTQSNNKASSGV